LGVLSVSYENGKAVGVQWHDCGSDRSALCLLPDEPITKFIYARPEDHRDPMVGDERFLHACGIRPADMRDELRVLDR
jgi:hypothetical protein